LSEPFLEPVSGRSTLAKEMRTEFLFGEVWSRAGLDQRERMFITLSCIAASGNLVQAGHFVRGALQAGVHTLPELREFTLHFAIYCGWPLADQMDDVISRVADELGLEEPVPHYDLSLEREVRLTRGEACWESVMTFPPPPRDQPYSDAGMLAFVFGEMWGRPALDRKARRFITLACVGVCAAHMPIVSHVWASMNSGDVNLEEMREFVLHFAVFSGWPKASQLHMATEKAADVLAAGGTFADMN
jgi:4-carboxymuconolactone decarboxylase